MEKNNYHHGALKEELIQQSIMLINEEGIQNFSLRKVAARCNVSHTAPYKHFKNKEELMDAIVSFIMKDFKDEIIKTAEAHPDERCMLSVGQRYVTYMLEHRDYFNFLFLGENQASVMVKESDFQYREGHPFGAFKEVATQVLKVQIPDDHIRNNIILKCWCTVHGLAHLLICGILKYEGDIDTLTESILENFNMLTDKIAKEV